MGHSIWDPKETRLGGPLSDEDFVAFQEICAQHTDPKACPSAAKIEQNVPIYHSADLYPAVRGSAKQRQDLMDEFHRVLAYGPGVFIVRGLIATDAVDRAQQVSSLIRTKEGKAADPTSKGSKRGFGYTTKHAVTDPESFAEYYANDLLALVCEAWLGPGYQITASTNATFAGAEQQLIHRDYHMSHNPPERIRSFPLMAQITSLLHTLQCAIAHTDMPLECGPTRFMPFSQEFPKGYLAVREARYTDWVDPRMVQLPLKKGDAVVFGPGIFHQPGVNITENERVANLLQVNATFMRPMEVVNRHKMAKAVWPVIRRWAAASTQSNRDGSNGVVNGSASRLGGSATFPGTPSSGHQDATPLPLRVEALISATCDDFGYPKQMDGEPKGADGCQAALIRRALAENLTDEEVFAQLDAFEVWHQPYFV